MNRAFSKYCRTFHNFFATCLIILLKTVISYHSQILSVHTSSKLPIQFQRFIYFPSFSVTSRCVYSCGIGNCSFELILLSAKLRHRKSSSNLHNDRRPIESINSLARVIIAPTSPSALASSIFARTKLLLPRSAYL